MQSLFLVDFLTSNKMVVNTTSAYKNCVFVQKVNYIPLLAENKGDEFKYWQSICRYKIKFIAANDKSVFKVAIFFVWNQL